MSNPHDHLLNGIARKVAAQSVAKNERSKPKLTDEEMRLIVDALTTQVKRKKRSDAVRMFFGLLAILVMSSIVPGLFLLAGHPVMAIWSFFFEGVLFLFGCYHAGSKVRRHES